MCVKMKAIVRDDIISLNSFIVAEFKYKSYLELLMKAGNYCFLDQFKKLIPSGQTIIKGMLENNLVATENINKNYKYVYLTDTAMKYLCLKDSDKDYSDVEKNRISVMKVNKYPSEKQLLSSAYKFHLIVSGEEMIDKESVLNGLIDFIMLKEHGTTFEKYKEWFKHNSDGIKEKREDIKKTYDEINHFKKVICNINRYIFDTKTEIDEINELNRIKKDIELEIREFTENKGLIFRRGNAELNSKLSNIDSLINELNKRLLIKKNSIKNYNNYFSEKENINKNFEIKINEFERQFNEKLKNIEEKTMIKIEASRKIFENLYNISKVIARIKESTLEFIIFDIGTLKTAFGYIKLINKVNELSLGYENVKIIIYSYAEHRALNLNKEFCDVVKKRIKARDTLRTYNSRVNEYDNGQRPEFYINANKIYNSIPDFKIEIRSDFYYMGSYKEFITSGSKSIKRKDKKVIEELILNLK